MAEGLEVEQAPATVEDVRLGPSCRTPARASPAAPNCASASRHVRLRRPKTSGPVAFRGVEPPRYAEAHVTAIEECDRRGAALPVARGAGAPAGGASGSGRNPPLRWVLATSFPVDDARRPGPRSSGCTAPGGSWSCFFRLVKSDGAAMEQARTRRLDRWLCLLVIGMEGALDAEDLVGHALRRRHRRPLRSSTPSDARSWRPTTTPRCHPAPIPGIKRPGGPRSRLSLPQQTAPPGQSRGTRTR